MDQGRTKNEALGTKDFLGAFQRPARRDLGASPTLRQRVERVFEWQTNLLRVPTARVAGGHCVAIVDLHPKAVEAECSRAFRERLGFVAETVTRLASAAPGAQYLLRRYLTWRLRRRPRRNRS